ncbi:uncharacterized protein LOC126777921 [Nymphalis io]|uniref:uncharacterized protein LOC126777921 n=1 Tax=Inachis io TaxID=171585 RepID=UPI00216A100D|nr:uncharacterized protein LOC126777921 [Nymphalis io]XP_050357192.1 uncharacterized protein LOC126777921 [Nymphalis io]XP_050357193.1 uncharacterized protein LOC126777921 [Nymphalis io]XP_050357194.1 uncharacterized protein LOC126777921 [Nymphalis io]XP_050357195.1 uncharacterized protein LOC126777921 [Nymphalis io]
MADFNKGQEEEDGFQCIHCTESSSELLTCKSCSDQYHYEWVETEKTEYKDISEEFKLSWLCPECSHPQDGDDDFNKSTQAPTAQESIMNEKISSTKAERYSRNAQLDACMELREDLKAVLEDLKLENTTFLINFSNKLKDLKDQMAAQPNLEKVLLLLNKCAQIQRCMTEKQNVLRKYQLESEEILSHLEDITEKLYQIELN